MDKAIQADLLRKYAYWPLSICEAGFICLDKIREIQKDGGSRQRTEGVKLLRRVYKRTGEALERHSAECKAEQVQLAAQD